MLKIVGAVMIFAACTGMGFGKGVELRRRLTELMAFKRLLLLLRGEIKYAGTPLPEAFFRISTKSGHTFSTFLEKTAKDLEMQNGESLQQIWEKNLDVQMEANHSALSRSDQRKIKELGSQLGYLDREMQIATIDFYVEQLEGEIQLLEQEKARKCRVYHCLGMCCGVLLNVLLL